MIGQFQYKKGLDSLSKKDIYGKNCIEIFRLVLIFDQNCYLFDRNKLDLRISYVFDDPDWD